MQLADAQLLANKLLIEFGLHDEGWIFDWDSAQRRFGCCYRSRKLITLSRILVSRNDPAKVEDTIRHEIAHALCGPRVGHGAAWKAMCKRTGANPVRCYDSDEVDTPEGNWNATCGGCGVVHSKIRRPKRDLWCARRECKRQNPPPFGERFNPICKLEFRHKSAPKPNRAAIEAMKVVMRQQQGL